MNIIYAGNEDRLVSYDEPIPLFSTIGREIGTANSKVTMTARLAVRYIRDGCGMNCSAQDALEEFFAVNWAYWEDRKD